MEKITSLQRAENLQKIVSNGVLLKLEDKGFGETGGKDLVYPYIVMTLCLNGSARAFYDMKEIRQEKNTLSLIMPGHLLQPIEYSEDFRHAWLLFDPMKFVDSELKFNLKDVELFEQAPVIQLTDEQVANLMSIVKVIDYIASRTEEELPNKHRLLEAQLTLAYELYTALRRNYDANWEKDRVGNVYLKFCDLVAKYYKQERNVNFYANQLGYDQRYFSKIFRAYNNGTSPLEWIQNYVCMQAKRLINDNPNIAIKTIALDLGFPTTANFCRYFKRATGIYPQAYKETLLAKA